MTYASSADLASYLRLPAGVEDSGLMTLALAGADSVIDGYLDRSLTAVTDAVATLDGDGSLSLRLPVFPVSSVTLVRTYGEPGGAETTLVANTDYVVDLDAGVLYGISGPWPSGYQLVKVTYSYAGSVPTVVRVVAVQVAARIYDVGMAENESTGAYSVTHVKGAGSLTRDEKDALYVHRRAY